MTFAENLASDMTNVILNTTEWGESVTYTQGSASRSINAVVNRDLLQKEEDDDGVQTQKRWQIAISTGSDGIANPLETDTVTIGSEIFGVEAINSLDGGGAVLDIVQSKMQEKSQEGHRKQRF